MTKKNITLTAGIVMAAVFLGIYVFLRKDFVEKNYIAKISASSASIENLVKEYLQSTGKADIPPYQMRSLLASIIEAYPDTALAAISGSDYKIKEVNQKSFVNDQVASDFQSEYSSGAITPPDDKTPVFKVYTYKHENKEMSSGMYIFVKDVGQYKIAIAYPFVLDIKALTRLALEIILIIISVVIISSFIYILLGKREQDDDFRQETGQSFWQAAPESANNIYDDYAAFSEPSDPPGSVNEIPAIIDDIIEKSGASSIFLYAKNNANAMASIYGKNNGGIAKSGKILSESIVKELAPAAAFLTDKSTTLILPLKKKGDIVAALELKKDLPFNRADIRHLKALSQRLIEKIPVPEKEPEPAYSSGLNKDALQKLIEKYRTGGNDFSIVFISCFAEMGDLDHTQRDLALQFIMPEIKKYIGRNDKIFKHGEYIALLMEDAGSSIARLTTQKISEILSKLRFKVDERHSLLAKPVFSIASTDDGIPPEKLAAHALKGMNPK